MKIAASNADRKAPPPPCPPFRVVWKLTIRLGARLPFELVASAALVVSALALSWPSDPRPALRPIRVEVGEVQVVGECDAGAFLDALLSPADWQGFFMSSGVSA